MLAVLRQIHRPGKPHKKREEGFMREGLHLRPLVGRDEPQQRFIGPADLARDVVAGDRVVDRLLAVQAAKGGSPETGVGGCGAYRKALASLGTRSPRARSAAAVNPLRGSSATLRPSG